MYKIFKLVTSLVLILAFSSTAASGLDNSNSPFSKSCRTYNSPRVFIEKAAVHCLKEANSSKCDKAAKSYFKNCGYVGDYDKISARVHTNMLLMLVLAGTHLGASDSEGLVRVASRPHLSN